MQQLEQIFTFILENKELFATFLVTLVTILKLTSWGRSEAAALDAVIEAVERVDDKKVKRQVAARQAHLNTAVQDALDYAVSKVDPKKKTIGVATRVAQEVLRGVLPPKK